jgi:hypothetical protein
MPHPRAEMTAVRCFCRPNASCLRQLWPGAWLFLVAGATADVLPLVPRLLVARLCCGVPRLARLSSASVMGPG